MLKGDVIAIVIAGLLVVGLLGHYAISGKEIPVWQALTVAAVNLVAAGRLYLSVKKSRQASPASKRDNE
ncbi:MAG: hypothetical protein ACK4KV_20660 [Rhodocyclaceae bacterium]